MVKKARSGVRMEVKVYLHQSKIKEGCGGPAQGSRAPLAVGCWQPGEKEWKPLREKQGEQPGREGQSQEVRGVGVKSLPPGVFLG